MINPMFCALYYSQVSVIGPQRYEIKTCYGVLGQATCLTSIDAVCTDSPSLPPPLLPPSQPPSAPPTPEKNSSVNCSYLPRGQTAAYMRCNIANEELLRHMERLSRRRLSVNVTPRTSQSASSSTQAGAQPAMGFRPNSPSSSPPTHFFAIAWGCAKHLWPMILSQIQLHTDLLVSSIQTLHATHLGDLLQRVYAVDDISVDKVRIKERHLNGCPSEVMTLRLTSHAPDFRKKSNGKPISRQMEALKAEVRGKFRGKVANYTHDIIFHAGDNEIHTRHLEHVFGDLRIEAGCDDVANKIACVPQVMQALNVSTDDYLIVGSAVLQDALGRPPGDVDILVRPALRGRISRSPHALKLSPSVQMISLNWLKGRAGVGDEDLLDKPLWHRWSIGANRLKYARPELAWFRKCSARRTKDLADVNTGAQLPILWNSDIVDALMLARHDAQLHACMDKVLRPVLTAAAAAHGRAGQLLSDVRDAGGVHSSPASYPIAHGRGRSPAARRYVSGYEALLSATFGPRHDPTTELIRHIRASNSTVVVMAFWWTWLPIAEALVDAHARGVAVKVLVDNRTTTKPIEGHQLVGPLEYCRNIIDFLKSRGVPAKVMKPTRQLKSIFHHKALIIDGKLVCMGSSNWYELSLRTFDDLTVCMYSHKAAGRFMEFAESRWASSGWPSLKETVRNSCPPPARPSPTEEIQGVGTTRAAMHTSLSTAFEVVEGPYFGPECKLDDVWFRYIASAMRHVRIVHWRIEWEPLLPWLASAHARGVSISMFSSRIAKLLLNMNSTRAPWADRAHIFNPSRAKNTSSQFHFKIVLIDDDVVLLGSCNLFRKSIQEDSEDLIVLRSRNLSRQVTSMYESHSQFPSNQRWSF